MNHRNAHAGTGIPGEGPAPDPLDPLRRAGDTMPEALFLCDAEGRWEYVNDHFYRMTGLPPGAALGHGWKTVLHPEDARACTPGCPGMAATDPERPVDARFRTRTGSYRWHRIRIRPLPGADATPDRWIGVASDVHDLKARAPDRAVPDAEPDGVGPAIAHDLREPLRSIRLVTAFLREDRPGMDEATARTLSRIDNLAARAEGLVGALADHARLGREKLRPTVTDLNAVVGEAARVLAQRITAASGDVRLVGPLPAVSCDPALIARLFGELITNGLTFNRSEAKRIEIGARGSDPWAPTVFVRDNGIGIEPRRLGDVFRMFVRLNAREDYGAGIGAGLAIARRIVDRHGGRIWAESEPGRGSTFVFTLPRAGEEVGGRPRALGPTARAPS